MGERPAAAREGRIKIETYETSQTLSRQPSLILFSSDAMRFLGVAAIVLLLGACNRLSPNERRVVGTWVVNNIDSNDYTIVRPNHTYEEISDLSSQELELLCLGHWRIEGDDIVTDCTTPAPRGLEKQIHNPTYSHRYPIDYFLKGLKPHAPISYKSP